ncbi:MAG: hypothetical protein DIZ80_06355 [endosymbiont of Galathealinum brachiosum]|uniref:J domain-containing protein n=1 Tax=endosymbiont of Galathealinum brachiosum TaxID=2200906 RepID=A0A370DFQ3_9GAMM|nr:MAG: hypothetical protein DIZ80_06355 [endosymbiont of Galathealinum brachiosum]
MKFNQHYRTLGLKTTSSWKEVRKSYKLLVQKYHPDKIEKQIEHTTSTDEKIKIINNAYQALSTYYRKHGSLPIDKLPEAPKTDSKDLNTNKAYKEPTTRQEASSKPTNTKTQNKSTTLSTQTSSSKKLIYAAIVLILMPTTMYVAINNSEYDMLETHDQINTSNDITETKIAAPIAINTNKAEPVNVKDTVIDQYFSYGSTLGEVIFIQGSPTKIKGDIWYYGKSEIHFKNGEVTYWKRTSNNPLKARLSIQ